MKDDPMVCVQCAEPWNSNQGRYCKCGCTVICPKSQRRAEYKKLKREPRVLKRTR